MTHRTSKLSRPRTAGTAQISTYRIPTHRIPVHRIPMNRIPTNRGFAAAAPAEIAAARASTTLALSMMVALRYLEGRASRPTAANPVPDPALS